MGALAERDTVRRRLERRETIQSRDGTRTLAFGDLAAYTHAVTHRLDSALDSHEQSVRDALADIAGRTHERFGTATPPVCDALRRLRLGAPILRVSHQPNLLAALNVVGLPLLQVLAAPQLSTTGIAPVVLLVLVDHDAAGDRRFRAPQVPRSNGVPLRLAGGVAKQDHDVPMGLVRPLSRDTALRWSQQLEQATAEWSRYLRPHCLNISDPAKARHLVRRHMDCFAQRMNECDSLAQGSASFNSHLLNTVLNLDVVCVPESQTLMALPDAVAAIAAAEAIKHPDSTVWVVCDYCFERRAASVSNHGDGDLVAKWACKDCLPSGRSEPVRFDAAVSHSDVSFPRFLPRVGLSDRLDVELYRAAGGISYAGGASHVLAAREAAYGRGDDPAPELIWEPVGVYGLPGGLPEPTDVIGRGRCPTTMYTALTPDVVELIRRIAEQPQQGNNNESS